MGNWLFPGTSKPQQPPATRLRVQSSIQGVVKPIVWGQTRIAGNLIDYLDFKSWQQQSPGSGGKGGSAGVGGKGSGSSQTNYSVTPVIGICEGPISAVTGIWINKGFHLPSNPNAAFTFFNGSYSQGPSGYLTTKHPGHDLNYRGLAYAIQPNMLLQTSPELPQLGWEVASTVSFAYGGSAQPNTPPDIFTNLYNVLGYPPLLQGSTPITANSAIPDANPRDVIVDYLTNVHYGVGWPSNRLDSVMNDYSASCLALGLLISPALVEAKAGNQFLQEIADATNAGFRWSNGKLSLVPWFDTPITSGTRSNVTETHIIPTPTPTTIQPTVQVGVASFVSNIQVQRSGGGTVLQSVGFSSFGTSLSSNQYYVSPAGLYTFSTFDEGVSVDITYVSAAQASYQPFLTPIYDISDFLPNEGGAGTASGNQPIIAVRKPTYYQYNSVKLEWLDRNNNYDPSVMEVKDQAAIDAFALRSRDIKQSHMFCLGAAATMSATLQLQREKIANIYTFTVGPEFILLEVEDIVTLTRPVMGLNKQPVRITEIQENSGDTLTITAEEFMGTVGPPLYNAQFAKGVVANYNVDPGSINTPWIFEPPDALGGGLEIWGAVSGQNIAVWGGAHVWASYDNMNFAQIGTIQGPSRMGITTSSLPSVAQNMTGQTIDNTNVLSVDLTESAGTLLSASGTDFSAFNSKCWVGSAPGVAQPGEVVGYQNAVLNAPNKYSLMPLNRGGFGSPILNHPTGVPFARLDSNIFMFAYDQSRIGSTVYFKFQSFNVYGGGVQDLSTLPVVSYLITGAALTSALPSVTNVRSYFEAGFLKIYWDEITDFRNGIVYEIRKGATFASGLTVGILAHPPFVAFGNDTFWISARCQPVAGLIVYSATAVSISIQGNVLTPNVIKTWDEQATDWSGTFSAGLVKQGIDPTAVLTLSPGVASAIYLTPANHWIDIGYVATVSMNASWVGTGAQQGQNILSYVNFLAQPDILSAGSAQFVDVHLEIAVSQLSLSDVYALSDVYGVIGKGIGQSNPPGGIPWEALSVDLGSFNEGGGGPTPSGNTGRGGVGALEPILVRKSRQAAEQHIGVIAPIGNFDIYGTLAGFNNWQKFVPGVYTGRTFAMRAVLTTLNTVTTIPFLLSFVWTAIVPARIDHYSVTTSAAGDTTVPFQPDGASVVGAFNFGPNGSTTPYVSVTIINPVAGDLFVQTSLSLSQLVFSIQNGGSRVVRNVNLTVEGA